jgi:hypothetical protein
MPTRTLELDSEDLILLLLEANERLLHKDAISGITRLEKLLFLLKNETDFEGIANFFIFEPHNFGPFSKQVYEAVDFLEGCELIQVREKSTRHCTPAAMRPNCRLKSPTRTKRFKPRKRSSR